jgi:uncharacterized protein (TIGR02596 family)
VISLRKIQSGRSGLRTASSRSGFTLVEMLVVLAIIAILAVLSLPAVKGVLGSMDLKGAANITTGQFELARQTAATRNLPVDLRIYSDPNTLDPNAVNAPAYRLTAVVIPASASGAANDEFVSTPLSLPGDIVYDQLSTTTYSTLLNVTTAYGDSNGNVRYNASESTTAPSILAGRPYVKITFLPNGTVSLAYSSAATGAATAGSWCLTMHNLHAKETATVPPGNYVALVLDPGTSRVRVFQPGY